MNVSNVKRKYTAKGETCFKHAWAWPFSVLVLFLLLIHHYLKLHNHTRGVLILDNRLNFFTPLLCCSLLDRDLALDLNQQDCHRMSQKTKMAVLGFGILETLWMTDLNCGSVTYSQSCYPHFTDAYTDQASFKLVFFSLHSFFWRHSSILSAPPSTSPMQEISIMSNILYY